MTTYDDYSAHIERIANGEKNVLTAYHTEHFSLLSGIKRLPQSRWSTQAAYDYGFCAGFYVAASQGYLSDGMTLNLVDNSVERLPSGLVEGSTLGWRWLSLRSQVFIVI